MKIVSTNIGKSTTIFWNGQETQTGIYKYPSNASIFLNKEDVSGDTISDRRVHGGIHKACYLFSENEYVYWKKLYPKLKWDWGMFGENLTVANLDESKIRIGDIYKIGTTLVQVSQSREPCYKLGIRFDNIEILQQFIAHGRSGAYVRVLEEGEVKAGDEMILVKQSKNTLTIQQYFELIFAREKDINLVKLAVNNKGLPERKRLRLENFLLNPDGPARF